MQMYFCLGKIYVVTCPDTISRAFVIKKKTGGNDGEI
jgi:hypothetical protein